MDKITKAVLSALKTIQDLLSVTYDFLKEGLIKRLLFYFFSKLLGFGIGYSKYLALGVILTLLSLTTLFEIIESIRTNI
jgi:hypothetical protein